MGCYAVWQDATSYKTTFELVEQKKLAASPLIICDMSEKLKDYHSIKESLIDIIIQQSFQLE